MELVCSVVTNINKQVTKLNILSNLIFHYNILVMYRFTMQKCNCHLISAEAFQYSDYQLQCLLVPVELAVILLMGKINCCFGFSISFHFNMYYFQCLVVPVELVVFLLIAVNSSKTNISLKWILYWKQCAGDKKLIHKIVHFVLFSIPLFNYINISTCTKMGLCGLRVT